MCPTGLDLGDDIPLQLACEESIVRGEFLNCAEAEASQYHRGHGFNRELVLTQSLPAKDIAGKEKLSHLAPPALYELDGSHAAAGDLEAVSGLVALSYDFPIAVDTNQGSRGCRGVDEVFVGRGQFGRTKVGVKNGIAVDRCVLGCNDH